ncbi:redox-sensing transcriptional repressor Rex [Lentisphaera profundi]|uniref:Redox-sensing transcriptional repressor Rex n=1 Tax=Lentisphaera profundi TaxID=1658616 RepID=A0ABY7VSS9_9BACT|nr:redox-sensing transcriptional repressor Rex [Lentisphaera profundi]WDE96799.1 redox-sensing transcriptional repressor Rex [Lentisphaera profundi]
MPQKRPSGTLSPPVIQRLSEYLLILEQFITQEQEVVSSRALATVYGNNSSQVRHDIFQIEHKGSQSHGYLCIELIKDIRIALNLQNEKNLCIIGMGNLGRAITAHVPFDKYGMNLSATFDIDPDVVGKKIGGIEVYSAESMMDILKEKNITMAALCVPATRAQKTCDQIIHSGVKGILNYSRIRLKVPEHVSVHYEQIICSFMQLSYKCSL